MKDSLPPQSGGANCADLDAAQERALDGVYTRMLPMALDVHLEDHLPNFQLFDVNQEYLSRSRNEE